MLSFINTAARSWISKILIWGVALTFVGAAFVVLGDVNPTGTGVAVVAGEEISRTEFSVAQRNIEARLRQQFGAQFDPALLDSLNAPKLALDSLVNASLQEKAARDAGFFVTDQELGDYIAAIPEFLTEGKFDSHRYFDLLQNSGLQPQLFERQTRRELLIKKLRDSIDRVTTISDAEAYTQFLYENQPIIVRYVKAPAANELDKVKVSDDALATWYDLRKTDFLDPEVRSFRTLTVQTSSFEAAAAPTDKEITAFYEENINDFWRQEGVRASHILIEVSSNAPQEVVAAAKVKIDAAHARILSGEDFAAVARDVSEGPTGTKGGDLGFFGRGQMVPTFEKEVYALSPGQVSAPFRTDFGWHVAKLTGKNEEGPIPLAEIKEKVTAQARARKATELARSLAKEVSATVSPENFAAVTDQNPEVKVNSYTIRKGAIDPTLDYPRAAEEDVFILEEKQVSGVIEVDGGFALVMVDKITPPVAPPLDTIRDQVARRYQNEQAQKLAEEKALRIERAINEGTPLEKVAATEQVTAKVTKPFDRSSFFAGGPKGKEDGMLMEAFELLDDEAKAVPFQGDYLVITVAERLPVASDKVAEKLPGLKETLLNNKRNRVYAEYVASLRKKAEEKGEVSIFLDIK